MDTSPLSRVPLFATLPLTDLDALAVSLQETTYPQIRSCFTRAITATGFYIVLEGRDRDRQSAWYRR